MKQPVSFQNSPDVTFAGSLAYLCAISICSLGVLLLSLGYPEWRTIGGLFLVSLTCGVLSHCYLSHSLGILHIGSRGMEYFPVTGEKTNFRWQELAHIKVLPGWLWIYNKQGEKIFSYTYGLGKQHALIKAIARQLENRKIRPVIWPDVGNAPSTEATVRKSKSGGSITTHQGMRKKKKSVEQKVKETRDPLHTAINLGNKAETRERNTADTTPAR